MWQKIQLIWKTKELRNSIMFVFLVLVIFRAISYIPVPGVDPVSLKDFFQSNQLLGLIDIFSGGGISNFSIVAMGVAPYITSSIIFQLLTMIIPAMETMSKENDGRQKINQYSRMVTVPLALLQSYGLLTLFRQSQLQLLQDLDGWRMLAIMIMMTSGTILLMWLGELISEKNIGNGISLLIFAGIVARIPSFLEKTIFLFDKTQIMNIIFFIVLALITIAGVVFITEGQRNIPVSYARRASGNASFGGVNTHLPLRVNQSGVIPIIFAISLILFPPLVAQFFLRANSEFLVHAANGIVSLFQNNFFYGALYFVLVIGFTFFYTSIIFQPQQIAENLQKQGGFIPGIRPGLQTQHYLSFVSNRVTLAGAFFLGIIAILPLFTKNFLGSNLFSFGGTSLLIVVSVVLETIKQISAQLTMRDYEGL